MKMQYEVEINRPVQEVWEFLIDPKHFTKWLNDLEKYERLTGDPGNPMPGDTGKCTYNQNGRLFVMDEKILACNAPHSMKLELASSMFDMEVENELTGIDSNNTLFASNAAFTRTGLVMKVILFFCPKSKMQGVHEEQLEKFKKLVEQL